MLSRRYLQSHLPTTAVLIVTFTVLVCCRVLSVSANQEDGFNSSSNHVILPSTSHNETDLDGNHSQGSETGGSSSNEADTNDITTSAETTATPPLSSSLFSSTEATTDLPPSSSSSSGEKSTVTILPASSSAPSMIITATNVMLGHRMLPSPESGTESNEVSTGTPSTVSVEELSTDAPPPQDNLAEESTQPETIVAPSFTPDKEGSHQHMISAQSSNRHSRFHRYHDNHFAEAPPPPPTAYLSHQHHQYRHEEDGQQTEQSGYRTGQDFHEASTEVYRELEGDGGDSYGDFGEDNELSEHLPTPMALINPNGEGNNPPLEDDFAEAFKKSVNSNGKRRRFRGGRRGKMRLKKLNDTNDSNVSSATVNEQEENHHNGGTKAIGSEWSAQQPTTASPVSSASPKKRYRSTTPNTFFGRSTTTAAPLSSSTENPGGDDNNNGPVVRNGPRPMILQSVNYDDTNSVTPMPQIEKPGNGGGHTEKISTYFFSTPSPSARLRLRQKIRESLPSSSSTTTTTTTTTEAPETDENQPTVDFPAETWKNEFSDFPQNPFFQEVHQHKKFSIPEFIPINLGLESDDRQEPAVENSLARPDPAENKAYTVGGHHHQHKNHLHTPDQSPSQNENYDTSYSGSSTTPKSQKMRRPSSSGSSLSESYSKHKGYDSSSTSKSRGVSPTASEADYVQGSNTEPSTTFSSAHRSTPGSHYDRTKDQVIFFNDSPYSTQHTSTINLGEIQSSVSETTPGSSSQTLGSHLSVSEGPGPGYYESPLSSMVTVDHHYPPVVPSNDHHSQMGMFTRGQVYPAEDVPQQLDSTFKNGPPDSSHIHSPNIIENAHPLMPSPTVVPSMPDDSDDLQNLHHQHLQHLHPHNHHNQQGSFSQQFLEDSPPPQPPQPPPPPPPQHPHHHQHHQQMNMPGGDGGEGGGGGGGDTVYGTVEEVPPHNSAAFEHLNPYRHYPPNMHHPHNPPPPPPGHMIPYPFSEHPRSPPLHAPAMPYPHHPPHNSFPFPPPHHPQHHGGEHPMSQPPLPPPPQSNLQEYHPNHHGDNHNSFAPTYQIHSADNEIDNNNNNNKPHDNHLISNHIAGGPSEINHPHELGPHHPSPQHHLHHLHHHVDSSHDGHPSGTSSSPTSASPPDSSLNSHAAAQPQENGDHQGGYNEAPNPPPPAPPPPPTSHMELSFPPHSHTMASHPDYEPANPPLPHDHPFHNTFIPFPPQDGNLLQQSEQHGGDQGQGQHDTNSIAAAGSSSGPYHPGIVETVPTGRPANSFEPSPLIPQKFTPIPDDIKETDLYSSFVANKQEEGAEHHPSEHHHPEGSLSPSQNNQHFQHPNEQITTYVGPGPGEDHSSYHNPHLHNHPSSLGPSGPIDNHQHMDINGYSGPVNEIHSGTYHPPNNIGDISLTDPSDSYRDHHHHHSYNSHHDLSSSGGPGPGYNSIHDTDSSPDYKPGGDLEAHDKPHHNEHDEGAHSYSNHGPPPHDIQSTILGGEQGKKEKKNQRQQASFSNTPYVLMFPQLIPEEKMRPSPPSLLSKEIPVIQASSMSDFTSSTSVEKSPMSPGYKAVPVHPRHQMYQVLAKTHYEKMMERYRESKKKSPSAIYTPYGILVPVGTNVDAAASMNHNVFAKPRHPPKFRGEKSLLNALLGSSSNHNRFHPPVMSNRLTKMFEYEPAIDVLAEKLAMKIVHAQKALNHKKPGQNPEVMEKSDGGKSEDDSMDKTSSSTSSRNPSGTSLNDKEDHMAMESRIRATIQNPELKDYLKNVLKGHLTEMVETTVSVEDNRRPPSTLSSKLLNSFFRKGRLGMNQPFSPPPQHNKPPSPPMLMQSSASMLMPNKVPPPPGMQSQPSAPPPPPPPPHHHAGMGHQFPPPHPLSHLSQGPVGLLGTIRRLFSFQPLPESRYDIGIAPNFGGRNMYSSNGTHLPYIDGPSPRSSHFPPQIILPHPNMIHQYPPGQQHLPSRIPSGPHPPPPKSLSSSASNGNNNNNNNDKHIGNNAAPTPKPSKKKRKPSSSSSSSFSSSKKSTATSEDNKWQSSNGNRHTSQSSSSSFSPSVKISSQGNPPQTKTTSTTTPKPNNVVINNKSNNYYQQQQQQRNGNNNNNSNNNTVTTGNNRQQVNPKKTSSPFHHEPAPAPSSLTKSEIVLNKRLGIQSNSGTSSSFTVSDSKDPPQKSPPKLDMFQTLLGSTRSVLNFFKAAEGRKSSGSAPTILEPRSLKSSSTSSSTTSKLKVEKESKKSERKRRSLLV